jgi:hypothetical protein
VVEPFHDEATPVILMTAEDVEQRMTGTMEEALELLKKQPARTALKGKHPARTALGDAWIGRKPLPTDRTARPAALAGVLSGILRPWC